MFLVEIIISISIHPCHWCNGRVACKGHHHQKPRLHQILQKMVGPRFPLLTVTNLGYCCLKLYRLVQEGLESLSLLLRAAPSASVPTLFIITISINTKRKRQKKKKKIEDEHIYGLNEYNHGASCGPNICHVPSYLLLSGSLWALTTLCCTDSHRDNALFVVSRGGSMLFLVLLLLFLYFWYEF